MVNHSPKFISFGTPSLFGEGVYIQGDLKGGIK